MQTYLTDYQNRLEAFQTGTLLDVALVSARVFEQPVAFTQKLMQAVSPGSTRLSQSDLLLAVKIVETAHRELVTVAGRASSGEPITVDFSLPVGTAHWSARKANAWNLRVLFHFVRDAGQDAVLPVVTIGFRDDFESS